MIAGIINGYYRTGTTIIYHILQESNPEIPIIYEPHAPSVYEALSRGQVRIDTIHPLHKIPIYRPYFMVEKGVLEEYLRVAKPRSVYTEEKVKEAVQTILPFHSSKKKVIIQSNQLHPVLHEVSKTFKIRYVHIVRDPAEVFYSHLGSWISVKRMLQESLLKVSPNLLAIVWSHYGKSGVFELRYLRGVAKRRGWLNGSKDYIEDFLRVYTNFNYLAYEQIERGKRGMLVKFEELVRNPTVLKKLARTFRLRVDEKLATLLDPSKAFSCPKRLREKIRKRCKGEVKRMLEELGYVL